MGDPIEVRVIAKKDALSKEIRAFESSKLKHIPSCNDRSAPRIEKVKTKRSYNRNKLCESIKQGKTLLRVDSSQIRDRSLPVIDLSIKIKHIQRKAFLDNLLESVQNLYTNLISGASAKLSQFQQQFLSSQKQDRTISPEQRESIKQLLCDVKENRNNLKHVNRSSIKDSSSPSVCIKNLRCETVLEADKGVPPLPKEEVDFHKHDKKQRAREAATKEVSEITDKFGSSSKKLDARLA